VSEDTATPTEPTQTETTPKTTVSATLILSIAVALLVGFIVAMNLKQKKNSVQDELQSKQAELTSTIARVNSERASLGLPPVDGVSSDTPEQIAARLTKDAAILASYADRFGGLLAEKDRAIQEKNTSILQLEQARAALSTQIGRMQSQLDQAIIDASGSASLRAQLDETRRALQPLQEQLASRPTLEQWNAANARIAALEAELIKLKTPTPTPPVPNNAPRKLFAESAADLYPMAKGLYESLSELNDKSDSEISAAYNRFASQYNATFLKEIRFPTGSSQLNPADYFTLGDALGTVPEGAMILVVGYASTIGNADSNRQLSSDRATTVATNMAKVKRESQIVQAVFLGQTQRFSSRIPERNQLCEVWQINPK
jgi:outer membrane protein OmpA-like peptidoglycan-associated protein